MRDEIEESGGVKVKTKQKNKTLHRIQKNISNYLNDPKPDKRKQSTFKNFMNLKGHK
mgnify:FL=1